MATLVEYIPALGTFPESQGFTRHENEFESASPPPAVVTNGILYQYPGPFNTLGSGTAQYWSASSDSLDFAAQSYVLEAELNIISSDYIANIGTGQRSGYYLSAGDAAGRQIVVGIATGGITINTDSALFPTNGVPFTSYDTLGFHKYRLEIDGGQSSLFIDSAFFASTPIGAPVASSRGPTFGDMAGSGSNESELRSFSFGTLEAPDLSATSLTIDNGNVNYAWSISGAAVTADPSVKLYWSNNDTFEQGTDTEAYSLDTAGKRAVNTYLDSLAISDLQGTPKSYLLLVADPGNTIQEADEPNEGDFGANNVKATHAIIPVDIDVKPGSDTNPINLAAKGVIPVTVFTTADFNAAWIDVSSIRFAGAAATQAAFDDVDGDGDLDLVLHFRLEDTYLLDVYADLLRQDLADGKLNDNHQAVDVLLTGRATSNGDEYFDFLGEDNVDLFLTGKKLVDFLKKL